MNATVTTTLRVFDDADGSRPLLQTTDRAEITRLLGDAGVRYEQWSANAPLASDADQDAVIAAYRDDIERLRRENGYTTVDVVRVNPSMPNLEAMRQKFLAEHTHSEDEVRFFVEGDASFYLRIGGKVYQTICVRGDLLGVPAGTTHWFDMGPSPTFTAIRLFVDPSGWVAQFTGDPIASRFPLYE